jgi:hypothetical protein
MDDPPANEFVSPRPGLLRTIGILNVALGIPLLICGGICCYLSFPVLVASHPFQLDPAQTREVLVAIIHELDAPGTQILDEERQALESRAKRFPKQVDFPKVNADLPWVSRYLWADVTTGPVASLLMVMSGVGLVRLRGWARGLAVWVAAFQVVRLAILSVLFVSVVIPRVGRIAETLGGSDLGATLFLELIERQKANGSMAVDLDPHEFVQVASAVGRGFALLRLGLGSIYPVIVMVVLTRPAARAAVSPSSQ